VVALTSLVSQGSQPCAESAAAQASAAQWTTLRGQARWWRVCWS